MSFLDAHNALRSALSQPQVTQNEKLVAAAKSWNATQCEQDKYDHSPYPGWGENLALGLRTPGEAVQAWFNEYKNIKKYGCPPGTADMNTCISNYMRTHFDSGVGIIGHFKNVASPGYREIGCSADVCSKPGAKYNGKTYYTCEYSGYPSEVPVAAVSSLL
jgi:uncharacterized protein YkwD